MKARLVCATAALLAVPRLASACPVCFGASDGAMVRGSSMGIFVLLIVTLLVLGAFATFFTVLARRAKAAQLNDEAAAQAGWQTSTAGSSSR